jgi:hypothetical protein
MPDRVVGEGQPEASAASRGRARALRRVTAMRYSLVPVGGAAFGMILGIGLGNLHGWDWALAGVGALTAAWLLSYYVSPTSWSAQIATALQPGAAKVVIGAVWAWALLLLACGYLLLLVAPFSEGLQTQEVGAPLIVQVAIIVVLLGVTFHLLFPLVKPKPRAMLVWRFTQGRFTAKALFALFFGLIVSTSIALWDQLLLLLARLGAAGFYLVPPGTGEVPAERVPLADLINGNHIFSLLVWQIGDMVPTLRVNDTIGFGQPLFYTSPAVGWLVLAFKAIVGLALIGCVLAIVKAQGEKPVKPAEVSLLPRATRRTLHRMTARSGSRVSTRGAPAGGQEPKEPASA